MRKNLIASALLIAFLATLASMPALRAQDGGKDMAPIEVELPQPLFVGTPKNIKTPNLEPARKGKKYDPILAPKGTVVVSKDKPVSGSDEEPIIGDLEQITDGDKEGTEGSWVELGPGKQYVQIDLGEKYELWGVRVWHFHSQARVYRDIVVQTANDPDFIMDVKTVFNNDHDNSSGLGVGKEFEYIETYEGRPMQLDGVQARFIRLYSNGNTSDEMNHYTEVEVYGKPAN